MPRKKREPHETGAQDETPEETSEVPAGEVGASEAHPREFTTLSGLTRIDH